MTIRMLLASSTYFIPIVYLEDIERELVNASIQYPCVILRSRNIVNLQADIVLDLLNYDAFKTALIAMEIEEDSINRLAEESECSPTVLRRRLSKNAAIRMPLWAEDEFAAKALIPMALIGAWHSDKTADQEIVSYIANKKYKNIEEDIVRLLYFDDSPVWSEGTYQGVVSKTDAIFAISRNITPSNLDRFFIAAESILSETDPALELPEENRWAAALYDKTRNHSDALRTGICETLVILSVHGNNLFERRFGINITDRVSILIHKLIAPLSFEKLLSQEGNLPRYAEAAPDMFLKLMEEDLRSDTPVVLGLLKPVSKSSLFGSPLRTGLLWALECLAWKPNNFLRVSMILARLAQVEIDDNWANKPLDSLKAIFRSWMPQTAASLEQRSKAFKILVERFPDVGWKLCIEQIQTGTQFGYYSYRPLWRSDASGAGQVVTYKEMYDFVRVALNLMIDWSSHDEKALGDLVEHLQGIPEEDQANVWNIIDKWSINASELAKATLREHIRRFAFTRQGHRRKLNGTIHDHAHAAYDNLCPLDPAIRHNWLFTDYWVQESMSELEDEEYDFNKRDERINYLRKDAMNEIWTYSGFDGIGKLLTDCNAPDIIGRYLSPCIVSLKDQVDFIVCCLSTDINLKTKAERCLQGFLLAIEYGPRNELLWTAAGELSVEDCERLFLCAPFQATTWHLLEQLGENMRSKYWKAVLPDWSHHTPAELVKLINCLLE